MDKTKKTTSTKHIDILPVPEAHGKNKNGNKYNFQFLMGGVQSPRLLTEADCNKYGFACGRW